MLQSPLNEGINSAQRLQEVKRNSGVALSAAWRQLVLCAVTWWYYCYRMATVISVRLADSGYTVPRVKKMGKGYVYTHLNVRWNRTRDPSIRRRWCFCFLQTLKLNLPHTSTIFFLLFNQINSTLSSFVTICAKLHLVSSFCVGSWKGRVLHKS